MSTDGGETWALVGAPAAADGFTSVEDMCLGENNKVYMSFGTNIPPSGQPARKWVYSCNLDGSGLTAGNIWGSGASSVKCVALFAGITWANLSGTVANIFRDPSGGINFAVFTGLTNPNQTTAWDYLVAGSYLYIAAGTHIYRLNSSGGGTPLGGGSSAPITATPSVPATNNPFGADVAARRIAVNGTTMIVGTGSGKIYRTLNYVVAIPVWEPGVQVGGSTVVYDVMRAGSYWYAGTDTGVYRTQDTPYAWEQVHEGVSITALAVTDAGKVIAGASDGKVYISAV